MKCVNGLLRLASAFTPMIVCGVCVSTKELAAMRVLPPARALSSWKRTHCAMSRTLELMEPAGPMLSMLRYGTARRVSSIFVWGVATSGRPTSALVLELVAVMPSGVKMRSRTRSSQLLPLTCAATCPAVRNMMFW